MGLIKESPEGLGYDTNSRLGIISDLLHYNYRALNVSEVFSRNITYSNSSISIEDSEERIYYHKDYLYLLLIIMIAFFFLSYYLHYVSKYNIKRAIKTNTENNITYMKYSNFQNLSIANFRI